MLQHVIVSVWSILLLSFVFRSRSTHSLSPSYIRVSYNNPRKWRTALQGRKSSRASTSKHEKSVTHRNLNIKQLNRRERMEIILNQYGGNCIWCNTPLDIDCATTDHIIPRIKGGPSWIENELAACRKCNKARGHVSVLDWIEICKTEKSFIPDEVAIESSLFQLKDAIEERGGQRKARPHLDRQLRILKKRKT